VPLAFYTLELCVSLVGFVVTDIQIFIAHNNIFIAYEYNLQTDSLVPKGIWGLWTCSQYGCWCHPGTGIACCAPSEMHHLS